MWNRLLDWILPKRKWEQYCRLYRGADGLLKVNLESALAGYRLFKNEPLNKRLYIDIEEIFIKPPVGTLYDLLILVRNATMALQGGDYIPVSTLEINHDNIRLDLWIKQPRGSEWQQINDVVSTFLVIGEFLETIDKCRGDKSIQYLERKLGRVLICFLTLVEIIGDHYGRSSEARKT